MVDLMIFRSVSMEGRSDHGKQNAGKNCCSLVLRYVCFTKRLLFMIDNIYVRVFLSPMSQSFNLSSLILFLKSVTILVPRYVSLFVGVYFS